MRAMLCFELLKLLKEQGTAWLHGITQTSYNRSALYTLKRINLRSVQSANFI